MSSPHEGLAESLQQLLRAYRRRLTLRTSVIGLLSVGCLSALLWRVRVTEIPRAWLMAIGGVGFLAVAGWVVSRVRRERLAATHLSLDLDRALGLEARLLTATELAQESDPPALYPVLLQETREAVAEASSRLPRVVDRWAALLTVALLMLLWRPRIISPRAQLAKLTSPPQPVAPPPQPFEPPPPTLQPPQARQSQPGSGATRQPQQGTGPSQPSQASSGQSPAAAQSASTGSSRTDTSGDSTTSGQQPSQQGSRENQREAPGQRRDSQPGQRTQSPDTAQGREADSPQGAQRRSDAQRAEQGQDSPKRAAEQSSASADGTRDQHTGRSSSASASSRQDAHASPQGAPMSGGQSPMEQHAQDALKGDIKQLLEQLSEELQSLQARVETQRLDRPHPEPGTSTDPQLYDDADLSPPADAAQRRVPVQLRVDQQALTARRPGGGVGEPSDEVATTGPQQLEEDAQLSEDPVGAEAVTRHAIPPEYQPVFERLSSQPEESLSP